jgi:hypothetical protein
MLIVFTLLATACLAPALNNARGAQTADPSEIDTSLIGIWDMTVTGGGLFHYKYSISVGSWVAIGDIDQGYFNVHYGPTVGAYTKNPDGSYRYRETGWTYTRGGVCNGTFESTGTFVLDASGNSFSGPGVFKQFDLKGNTLLTESFTVLATRIPVN